MDKKQLGLYQKFQVVRSDGKDQPGGPKYGARYFVLDYVNDPVAIGVMPQVIQAYHDAGYGALADDLEKALTPQEQ